MNFNAVYCHPENGRPIEIKETKALLNIGETYKIDRVEVDRYNTYVYLIGYNRAFNGVMFDFIISENRYSLSQMFCIPQGKCPDKLFIWGRKGNAQRYQDFMNGRI